MLCPAANRMCLRISPPTWLADLEARYNYEALETGSVWAGYDFNAGKKLVLDLTPMVGANAS